MSFADALSGKPKPTGSTAVSLDKSSYRAQKILAFGEYKSGKSTFMLSLFDYLDSLGVAPEKALVVILDNDDGIIPLAQKGAIAEKWYPCIKYALCTNFEEIVNNTNEWIPKLKAHQAEHGPQTAWLLVDNMKTAWQWTRDKYSIDIYGMHEHELAKKKRLEANSAGKKMLPTFDQRADYGVINPIHNEWAEKIKLSGVNFIWAAPSSSWTEKKEGADDITIIKAAGQGDNAGRVDQIVYLYTIGDDHYADLTGSRTASKLFKRLRDPSIKKLNEALKRLS